MSIITTKLCFHINKKYKTLILKALSQHSPPDVNLAGSPLPALHHFFIYKMVWINPIISNHSNHFCLFFTFHPIYWQSYNSKKKINECDQLTDINIPLG